ncbi:hypothetical protein D4764_03G0006350 [Takifugu flavidus]|uniref:Reverse transcriptase domain-containing protein n=1 Tax=Takifugu flavidus TaxID=433684 RepID=A0A5C6NDP0_9TELE|nr:hypothetical protein D4764_03G0006350 [Takifugu flavidus]
MALSQAAASSSSSLHLILCREAERYCLHARPGDGSKTTVRADRDTTAAGKKKGGGLAVFIRNRWCNLEHIHVKECVCSPDVELIAIGLRPYYLPREFTNVIAITVYSPPTGKANTACDVIHSVTADLQTKHPGAFILITGDFNHASLSSTLPTFHQYVQCSMRDSKTLDLLYANVTSALVLSHLRPLVSPFQDPLQFAYQPKVGVDDAVIYLLQRAYSSLDRLNTTVRVMFFDFSSAFNTIQPRLLRAKLEKIQMDAPLVSWIKDYLTGRPQFVRLRSCVSDPLMSNTGAPQGTVLSPFLFTHLWQRLRLCLQFFP